MAERDDDTFLERWSRRKRSGGGEGRPAESSERRADATAEPQLSEEEQQRLIDSLPDVDSLTDADDFSPFMQSGVPEALRQRALRRLWRLNPLYANLDGLNDYDLDYTDAAAVVQGLKTAYKVGKGFLAESEETASKASASSDDAPATPAEAPSPDAEAHQGELAADHRAEGEAGEERMPEAVGSTPASSDTLEPQRSRGRARARRWGFSGESGGDEPGAS